MGSYSISDRRAVIDRIEKLKPEYHEYIQLLIVIKKNGLPFTENENGIFCDLRNVSDESINQMIEIIEICEEERERNKN